MSPGPSAGSMVGSLPHTEETGGHEVNTQDTSGNVPKSKPLSGRGDIHETGGCDDEIGPRPQSCQQLLADELMSLMVKDLQVTAWDDVRWKLVDPQLVAEARAADMEYIERLGVHERVPRSHQQATCGKVITTMWLDVNKRGRRKSRVHI